MRYLPLPRGNERAGAQDTGMSRDFRKCYTLSRRSSRSNGGASEDGEATGFSQQNRRDLRLDCALRIVRVLYQL